MNLLIVDDLNNEDYDATWGGKRSRYLYNYTTLELPEELSNTDDSDQTESILSVQTKSTSIKYIYFIMICPFLMLIFLALL